MNDLIAGGIRPLGATVATPLLAVLMIAGYSHPGVRPVQAPAGDLPDIPDVSDIVRDLALERLDPPIPVLYVKSSPSLSRSARRWQILMLEARAFWRNVLGSLPDGGLILVDSPAWVALRPDREYGFPGTRVRTRPDGVLTMIAVDSISGFGEAAEELFLLAPIALRGLLLARGLASADGAGKYAGTWVWVQLGEDLTDGLRIGARLWWQRRLVGATAAWMLLESPRGKELAPEAARAMDAWGWFLRRYFNRTAVSLSTAAVAQPSGEQYEVLELDARLLAMGRAIWRQYGVDAFARMRRAWPHDIRLEGVGKTLDALWMQMPEMRLWEAVLLDPQSEEEWGFDR